MDSAVEAPATLPGLPEWETGFVGRAAERAAARAALSQERLVSLTGPAGAGKTRLAAAVASEAVKEFPAGGGFAELVPVRTDFLPQALAAALGVTERPGQYLEQALEERLGQGRCLLVVDGCEHFPEAVAGLIGRLLESCPGLVVLATGHEPLGLGGEHVLTVEPLPVAEEQATGAVALFLDRTREPGYDRRLAAQACARRGGLPLAVELAAAHAPSPGAADDDRHAPALTAERAVEWSYSLLDPDERRLFRRLGVFLRGFDAEAAHAVGGGSDTEVTARLLDRLTARALLVRGSGTSTGLRRMPGAVRAVALRQLGAEGEAAQCRARHLAWATATARALERTVAGADRSERAGRCWRARFDHLADDLRAALDNAGPHPAPAPHPLARALARLCYARQFLAESRAHFRTAGTLAPGPSEAAADLRAAADVAMAEHRGDLAYPLLRASAEYAATADDPAAQAVALSFAACVGSRFPATFTDLLPYEELRSLLEEARRLAPPEDRLVAAYVAAAEAWNATGRKTAPDAELAQEALARARAADDPVLIAGAIDAVCSGYGATGRFREAHGLSDERLRLFDRLPRHDPRIGLEIIDTLHVVPLVAVAAGDLPRAVTAARRAWDDPLSGLYMRASKSVAPLALSGRFDEALEYAALMWDGWQRAGRPTARWMAPAVHAAALVHGLRGGDEHDPPHREWRDRARRMAEPMDPGGIAASFAAFAEVRVALHTGAVGDALAAAVDLSAAAPWPRASHQFYDAYAWAVAAETAVVAGLPDARERLAAGAPAGAENPWAAACLARAAGRLHGDQDALRESLAGWERIDAVFERACTLVLLPDRAAEGLAQLASLGCRPPSECGSVVR
ncbi:ATP-binding protein [Streptomyces sp. NPDC059134]|uniref:ATP-binding protein n=1 Tax=Streptomyces sp. NPDC059134 TaxID=3346738 RepID=UPI003679C0E6